MIVLFFDDEIRCFLVIRPTQNYAGIWMKL